MLRGSSPPCLLEWSGPAFVWLDTVGKTNHKNNTEASHHHAAIAPSKVLKNLAKEKRLCDLEETAPTLGFLAIRACTGADLGWRGAECLSTVLTNYLLLFLQEGSNSPLFSVGRI